MGYDITWDRPHTPSEDLHWQESDCYWWYDDRAGVGGFHRVGQKPNVGTGQVTIFCFDRNGERFVAHGEHPISAEDRRATGHSVASHSADSVADGVMAFGWSEDASSGTLEFYGSFHEPRDWSKTGHSAQFMSNINSDGHLECSGRIRGKVRIGDRTYDVDGLCHRDRSWGFRDNARASLHRYRMFSGTCGPALSFASFFLDLKGGPSMVAGFVVRDGVDEDIRGLRVITTFDADGLTPMGATAVMTLVSGEQVRIQCDAVQGFLTPVPEAEAVTSDTISTFEYNGQIGFVDLELSTNPGRGTYIPQPEDVTLLAFPGLSKSVSYDY